MKYEIQTQFIYGWENVWACEGEPEYFDSLEDAQNALDEFFSDVDEDYLNGHLQDPYDRSDYRIVRAK